MSLALNSAILCNLIVNRMIRDMENSPRTVVEIDDNYIRYNEPSSPFDYTTWEDCGSHYKLQIHVQDVEITADTEKHSVLLNATIANDLWPTPMTDVKSYISFPKCDYELDESNIITHVDGENFTIKVFKINYEEPLPPSATPKIVRKRCVWFRR